MGPVISTLDENTEIMQFSRIEPTDLSGISIWWSQNSNNYVCKPDLNWVNYVINSTNVLCEKIFNDNMIFGYYQIDIEDQTSHISVVVNPRFYKIGIGSKLIAKAIIESTNKKCNLIQASIDKNNLSAIKLFERLKFQFSDSLDCDLLQYKLFI